jgi:dsDNA-specific endonuclease/ATPase MutS2
MIASWIRNFVRKTILSPSHREFDTQDDSEADPFNPFAEPVQIEITDVIDLHTIAPREVKRVIEEYLYQAHEAGFRSVRIIHGKGIGVQREMLRTILARTPFVADWTDASPQAGGLGATVVILSRKDATNQPV